MLMRNEWRGRHTIPGALLYVCFFCAPSFLAARAAVHAAAAPAPAAQAGGKIIAPPPAPAKIHPASSAPKTIEFATIPTTAVPVQAAVSPDGKLLAYCSPQTEGATIWIRELITGVERQLLPRVYGECRDIAFSPDGQSVFYVMRLMDSDSAMRVSLAGGSPPTRVVSDLDSRISLSPQSNAIAFLRYDQVAKLQTVVTIQSDGSGQRVVARAKNEKHVAAAFPAWSPSGDQIAYAQADVNDRTDNVRLMTVQIPDGQPRELGESRWQTIQQIFWMPNGHALAVIGYGPMPTNRYITIKPELWFVDYPSGHAHQLTDDPARFRGLSAGVNGDLIYTVRTDDQYTVSVAPLEPSLHPGIAVRHLAPSLPKDCQRGTLAWVSERELACAYPSVVVGAGWKMLKFSAVDATAAPSPSENLHCPQKSPIFVGRAAISNQVSVSTLSMSADAVNKDVMAILPACLPDGSRTAYSMYSPLLRQVQTYDGDYVPSSSAENHYSDAASSPDGRWVVTMDPSGEQRLLIWDAHRNAIVARYNLAPDQIGYLIHGSNLSWTPDSKAVLILLAGPSGTNLWEIPVDPSNPSAKFAPVQLTDVQEGLFYRFAISPDGKEVALAHSLVVFSVLCISGFHR